MSEGRSRRRLRFKIQDEGWVEGREGGRDFHLVRDYCVGLLVKG